MTNDKDINHYLRCWLRNGGQFLRGGKHGKLILPNGRIVIIPCSPGDHRALKNLQRDVRRQLLLA